MNRSVRRALPGNALLLRACMLLFIVACMVVISMPAVAAPSDNEKAQTVVHMLDYIGVDYPEFVQDGKVMNAEEYQEQREFATQSLMLLEQLPAAAGHAALLNDARQLLAKIDAKAAGSEVSALSGKLRADIIRAYKLSVAPRQTPDLAQGARLFAAQCAACHGAQGRGDGPLAKGLEPSPSDFHDEARMTQRSLYGLYNTISLGVGGTPMRAFSEFSEADRWALAFFVGSLRSGDDSVAKGEAAWRQGDGKTLFTGMQPLVTLAPNEVADKGGNLDAVRAYLTRHPDAVQAARPAPLDFTRAKLEETERAYRTGDREAARQLAIAAYLEGFELVESALDNVDAPLRTDIEREMMALRAAVGDGKPADTIAEQVKRVNALLERAEEKLSRGNLSPTAAFVSSLLILLREGLEAILVLSAITAFVVKTGRRDALPYIHAGWMGAVALGVVTWLVARYVLRISGANRELTEGFTALLAAAMLLYVGYWLHSRSNAQAWQSFIRNHVNSALGKRTLWAMAGISFLAVYRELFEVILFYETLWAQVGADGQGAVIGGIVAAAILLVLLGGGILRYSVRLPIGPFFAATSGLLALMAIVFVGNGVAALQEAGVLPSTLVNFFTLPLLGIHPTSQGLSLQAATLLLVITGLWLNRRKGA
ncbi:cytochrome c/FTR1 family iron permease [Noviherbaspirillum sp. Root189]|uniref:cytochrome c/FTR1 family iron permease n=1 Tax=Noviherbaspirillum sp. Root189 TaxID=1736487 RepID=UPI00070969E0|nr:cytochrome c/FTR1 family iron permease [Noviherbaspirillum sp. Root189]KRB93117.1 cytochrome C [Noviherbaspirillum sp. Root189]